MIKLLWQAIKLLLPLLPFLLFTLLNAKANLSREQRSRQYLMPIFALVYCLALITVLEPINKFLLWLLNLLPDALQAVADWFASILEGRLSGIDIAEKLGLIGAEEAKAEKDAVWERLDGLRLGPHGEKRHEAKMNQIAKFKKAVGGEA